MVSGIHWGSWNISSMGKGRTIVYRQGLLGGEDWISWKLIGIFVDVLLFKIVFYWLCYYGCPDFSQFVPFHPAPHSLWQSPHHCSCPPVLRVSSSATPFPIRYFTPPQLFCNYLFVLLNPLTSSPIFPHTPPIWQPSKRSPYPGFCLCSSCLLSLFFVDSIVDRYVFIAIYCS